MKRKLGLGVAVAALAAVASAHANDGTPDYLIYDGGVSFVGNDGPSAWPSGPQPVTASSFEGVSQVDVRSVQNNSSAYPPDTSGVIGTTQFMETTNGAYAVYDKATGVRTQLIADGKFWQAAGQTGVSNFNNGDTRIMFDKASQRFIVESFGVSNNQIQIAVSDTSDALGTWHSTSFVGNPVPGSLADYPTLAIDNKAVYIGTNNFNPDGAGGYNFAGTTLNVINRNDLFSGGAPTTASLKQFVTPYDGGVSGVDRGFAIAGVNQVNGSDNGKVIAIGLYNFGSTTYTVNNPGTAGATQTNETLVDTTPYHGNAPARQPDGSRVVDTLDDRISSSSFEYNGNIYTIHTITPTGADHVHTVLEWNVVNAATGALVQKGLIGSGDLNHDYFQASIAVNGSGQVMVGYNKSGADENVEFFAQALNPIGGGKLGLRGNPILLHTSPIGNYHNGSTQFAAPVGRQRWGDYAQVSVDPNDPQSFWLIGEFAKGYLPSPTASFSRWGTWIADVNIAAVPEPATWALMMLGLGFAGATLRRRRKSLVAA